MARVGGDVQLAGWRVSGRRAPSGSEWNGSQSGQGATDLLLPWPTLGKMQGEAACGAGEPSGQGEDPSSERLGGHDLLTQADTGRPAGQVVRHHLYREPGGVGGEAARGEMVQPDAVLEVAYRILDLGVAAMVGDVLATVFTWAAQQELEAIRRRTKAGMDRARAEGKHIGRPKVLDQASIAAAHRLHRDGVSKSEIADALKVSRTTVRRALGS